MATPLDDIEKYLAGLAANRKPRPDIRTIEHIEARIKQVQGELHNINKDMAPGFSFEGPLREMGERLIYAVHLKGKSLDEARDITVHPDALRRKFPPSILVSQAAGICSMVDNITAYHQQSPAELDVFIDTEDDAVSGTLTFMQVFVRSANVIYVLDIGTLHQSAFTSVGGMAQDSRQILESNTIRKAIYQLQGDSHTLYKSYGICVDCITDLGLMALACYGNKKKDRDQGLETCVERCTKLGLFSEAEKEDFKARKDWARDKVFPETQQKVKQLRAEGKLETIDWVPLFNQRPVSRPVWDYIVWDVYVMPTVYDVLDRTLDELKHPFSRLDDQKFQTDEPAKCKALATRKAKTGDRTWRQLVEEKTAEVLKASKTNGFGPNAREGKTGGLAEWSGLHF